MSESSYPYSAKDGTCEYKSSEGIVSTVVGTESEPTYVNVSGVVCDERDGPEDCFPGTASSSEIMAAIAVKPNAVALYASSLDF